jgi:hypothetical protein
MSARASPERLRVLVLGRNVWSSLSLGCTACGVRHDSLRMRRVRLCSAVTAHFSSSL